MVGGSSVVVSSVRAELVCRVCSIVGTMGEGLEGR